MIDEIEEYFNRRFHAYTVQSRQSFRRVQGTIASPSSIGTVNNPIYGPMTVVDEPTVEIRMPYNDYQYICKKLYELDREEMMRSNDPQLFELWMKYQLWLNLKR